MFHNFTYIEDTNRKSREQCLESVHTTCYTLLLRLNRASDLENVKIIFLSADPEVVGHTPPAENPGKVSGPLPDAEVVGQSLAHPEVVRLPLLELQPVVRPGEDSQRRRRTGLSLGKVSKISPP